MTKQQIINYLKSTDLDIQSAKAALTAIDLAFASYVESHKLHKIKYNFGLTYISAHKPAVFYQSKKVIDDIAKRVYFNYLSNPKSLDKKIKEHQNLTYKLDKLWEKYKMESEEQTLKKLNSFFNAFQRTATKWWYYGVIGEEKGEIINTEIVLRFQKRHSWNKIKAQEIVSSLAHPKEQAIFNLERKDFLKICLYILENIKLKKF